MSAVDKGVKSTIEFIKELILILLAAFLFINFIFSHNKIPTRSMVSTINPNDHIITNILPYYYRDPDYGEIVVFHMPNEQNWVKRVIGKPGDVIDIIDGYVYRNGEQIDESAYVEQEGVSEPRLGPDSTPREFPFTVPEGEYFLMGDNRLESLDCRYLEVGLIKREQIYGKGWIKIYPFNEVGVLE